jgi:subtilase family serine protease
MHGTAAVASSGDGGGNDDEYTEMEDEDGHLNP